LKFPFWKPTTRRQSFAAQPLSRLRRIIPQFVENVVKPLPSVKLTGPLARACGDGVDACQRTGTPRLQKISPPDIDNSFSKALKEEFP